MDEDARREYETFVRAHEAALLRVAYLLCRDRMRSEDLVQDALVRVLRKWPAVRAADSPYAYARRVVVNEFLAWRRLRASREVLGREPVDRAVAPADADVAERDLVWRLIGTLPARSRAVLVLRYYEQLPDREIAAVLGCADATVRSLAARAFAVLRENPMLNPVAEEA